MRKKKVLSFIMAVLMLSLGASAFASGENGTTVLTAKCTLPEIRVTVPTSASVIINPTNVPINVGGSVSTDGVISSPSYILNESEVPVRVNVTTSATIGKKSDMRLVMESTKGQDLITKCVFMYLEMQVTDSPGQTVSWDSEYDEDKHLLIRTAMVTRSDYITLGADGQGGSCGNFRLTGDCVAQPLSPWTTKDTISVKAVFSFKPVSLI